MNDQFDLFPTPSDVTSFDPVRADQRKQHGMDEAAGHRSTLLEQAREAVIRAALARPTREAVADDAARWLIAEGRSPSELGNAAGSLFPEDTWEFTGRWMKSKRVSNHGHQNRIWRLR